MWWKYLLVFMGALIMDITPLPLPPAFTVMIFFQIKFHLDIWLVVIIGVAGSVLGRYVLTLYIPGLSARIFTKTKNEDVQFLGNKMKTRGWKSQLFILLYTLMPLPSTPLFIAGGMAKMKPRYLIPCFIAGKFISDFAAVFTGKYAAENTANLLHGLLSWQSAAGLVAGLLFIFSLLFINWHVLLLEKKLRFSFHIWK
jgi:membrane protein DedA with SNARE-associated domain